MQFDHELDARNLVCFMLTLRTKQAMDTLQPGQILRITTRDTGSAQDFQAFASQTGHELLSVDEANGERVFLMRKHWLSVEKCN
jgi:tRNA 2-thiouridine synthesizing protein A